MAIRTKDTEELEGYQSSPELHSSPGKPLQAYTPSKPWPLSFFSSGSKRVTHRATAETQSPNTLIHTGLEKKWLWRRSAANSQTNLFAVPQRWVVCVNYPLNKHSVPSPCLRCGLKVKTWSLDVSPSWAEMKRTWQNTGRQRSEGMLGSLSLLSQLLWERQTAGLLLQKHRVLHSELFAFIWQEENLKEGSMPWICLM